MIDVGVRLRADGKGLVGELRVSQKELDRLAKSTKRSNDAARQGGPAWRKYGTDMLGAARGARKFNQEAQASAGLLNQIKQILPAVGVAAFTSQVVASGLAMIKMRNSLLAVTGSTEAANQELQFIRGTADELGLQFESLALSYTKFLAASKGTELEGQKARDVFVSVAGAARVLGLSTAETEGALRALQQMMSKGNVQAEELRGQLGERLPGAVGIAARALGVTTSELNKMLDRGEVFASELLPKMAVEINKTFGDALPTATASAAASFARLDNALFDIRATVAESGFMDGLADSADRLTESLSSPEALEMAESLGEALGTVAENLDIVAIALGASFTAKILASGAAVKLLVGGIALLTGPAGIAAAAAAAIYGLVKATNEHESATETAERVQQDFNDAIKQGGDNAVEAAKKAILARGAEIELLIQAKQLAAELHGENQKTGGIDSALIEARHALAELQADLEALQNGTFVLPEIMEETGDNAQEAAQKIEEAAKKMKDFVNGAEQAAKVEMFDDRTQAGWDLWQKALKAGIEDTKENREQIERLGRSIYDQVDAHEKLIDAKKREAKLDENAAAAALDRLATEQNALLEYNELYAKRVAAKQEVLAKGVENLQQSLETETESIAREYDERLALLKQAEEEGITIIGGYQEARRRLTEQLHADLADLETEHVNEVRKIWEDGLYEIGEAATDLLIDPLFGKSASDAATDFFDDLEQIAKNAFKRIFKHWIESGIGGILSGQGLGGFSLDSAFNFGGAATPGINPVESITNGGNPLSALSLLGKLGGGMPNLSSLSGLFGPSGWLAANQAFNAGSVFANVPGLTFAGGAAPAAATTGGGLFNSMAGHAGAALPLAIGAFGFNKMRQSHQRKVDSNDLFGSLGKFDDQLNAVSSFRAEIDRAGDSADTMFVTMNEGFGPTIKALKEAGSLLEWQGSLYDEQGNELFELTGNIAEMEAALKSAAESGAVGFEYVGTKLEGAAEKGDDLKTRIVGNFQEIEAALNHATAMGIGGFKDLEQTATGASVVLTGDVRDWDAYLQSFVNNSVQGAINGIGGLASGWANAAEAASKYFSTIAGKKSSAGNAPSHYMGIPRVPRDNYPLIAHKGEAIINNAEMSAIERELDAKDHGGGVSDALLTRVVANTDRMVRAMETSNRLREAS